MSFPVARVYSSHLRALTASVRDSNNMQVCEAAILPRHKHGPVHRTSGSLTAAAGAGPDTAQSSVVIPKD